VSTLGLKKLPAASESGYQYDVDTII